MLPDPAHDLANWEFETHRARRRATRRAPPTARGAPDGQRVDEDHA